jgi:CDP-6-deoxy-D-xylo-4-hexulose-3-dehydrase
LCQLKRLDDNIQKRRKNFEQFVKVITANEHLFYPVHLQPENSNFAFPFLCKEQSTVAKLKQLFDEYQVEHRPVVGGNLLRQPFLKEYKFAVPKAAYNADILNDHGLYIGNSHFVGDDHFDVLNTVLSKI